ncbi:unnamed protein product [Vicia faba]|uniref:Uncharacterized protein n=1 Tax=Vicia faba TaxID=3906 RepID=A0AAV0Z9W1_VICFA|nr:unnamed protein product [Vicia faba]
MFLANYWLHKIRACIFVVVLYNTVTLRQGDKKNYNIKAAYVAAFNGLNSKLPTDSLQAVGILSISFFGATIMTVAVRWPADTRGS